MWIHLVAEGSLGFLTFCSSGDFWKRLVLVCIVCQPVRQASSVRLEVEEEMCRYKNNPTVPCDFFTRHAKAFFILHSFVFFCTHHITTSSQQHNLQSSSVPVASFISTQQNTAVYKSIPAEVVFQNEDSCGNNFQYFSTGNAFPWIRR